MKLYELMEMTFLEEGNVPCELKVETDDIAHRFGMVYEENEITFHGMDVCVREIPAHLGGCEVLDSELVWYKDGNCKLFVTI